MDRALRFGFWNYAPTLAVPPLEAAKDWAQLGCNLPMSFVYTPGLSQKSEMIALLDACQKEGLSLLIADTRASFRTLQKVGEAAFKKGLAEAMADFGHHPATFGFFIGDEPAPKESADFIRAAQLVREAMPSLTPFGNLLPYWCGSDWQNLYGKNDDYFDRLLGEILTQSALPLIGFDQYSQCGDALTSQNAGIACFLNGLLHYQKSCAKAGIPFYVSLLAIGHRFYRVPNEDDIRWQLSTSFALGARGILWFYFYQQALDLSYRGGPYETGSLLPTPLHEAIGIEQRRFISRYGKVFENLSFDKAYFLGYPGVGETLHEEAGLPTLNVGRDFPVLLSLFHDAAGQVYLALVNLSQTLANSYTLRFPSKKELAFYLAPGELALIDVNEERIFGE